MATTMASISPRQPQVHRIHKCDAAVLGLDLLQMWATAVEQLINPISTLVRSHGGDLVRPGSLWRCVLNSASARVQLPSPGRSHAPAAR